MITPICVWRGTDNAPICGKLATWRCMTADGRFNAGTYLFCDFHRTMAAIVLLRSGLPLEKVERIISRFAAIELSHAGSS